MTGETTLGRAANGPVEDREAPTRAKALLPSLDGLRAISIGLVLVAHGWFLTPLPVFDQTWRFDPGNLGVRVFFVISGFLITTLLLDEKAKSGVIHLPRFYFRRTFRLIPALWVFLLAMWLAARAGHVELPGYALLHAATYTGNYLDTTWAVGHTWSLAVEEQFYLLWPGLLALAGLAFGFRAAVAILFISPILRTVAELIGHWPANPRYTFECVADALATGCLLARHRASLWGWAPYQRLIRMPAFPLVWALVILIVAALGVRLPLARAAILTTAMNLAIAVAVDWGLRSATTPIGRILNSAPLSYVGRLSYSIYLWQQPFLEERRQLPPAFALAAIAVCAVASFHLVETPCLALRARLERRLFSRDPA